MNKFLVLIFKSENNHLYFSFLKSETRTTSVLTSQKYKWESGENCFLREIQEGVRSGGKIMKLSPLVGVNLFNFENLLASLLLNLKEMGFLNNNLLDKLLV
jgi:hypothetical protein